jgi:hypothetical protein
LASSNRHRCALLWCSILSNFFHHPFTLL